MSTQTIQQKIFVKIKEVLPNAEAKKIDKDNFLDILPYVTSSKKDVLFFNTKNETAIKIGFTCNDKAMVESIIATDTNQYIAFSGGLKCSKDCSLEEAVAVALDIASKCKITKSKVAEPTNELNLNNTNQPNNLSKLVNYEGEQLGGKKHGIGRFTDDSGIIWEGIFINDNFIKGKKIEPEGKTFEGNFENGKLTGHGKIWRDGKLVMEGEFKEDYLNGEGKWYLNDFLWQSGTFKNNSLNGPGKIFCHTNGALKEEGSYKDGKLQGTGICYWDKLHFLKKKLQVASTCLWTPETKMSEGLFENGIIKKGKIYTLDGKLEMEGEFSLVEGKPVLSGKGKFIFANGIIYEGDFVDGKRTGKGKDLLPDGNIYEGDFVDGKRTGKGKIIWTDGVIYEGDFIDNKRTGKGKFIWTDGDIYEGDFVDGKRTGKGKIIWTDGVIYEGDFVDGERTGKGKHILANGNYLHGFFENSRFVRGFVDFTFDSGSIYYGKMEGKYRHGEGKYTLANGDYYEGIFENDNFIKGHAKMTYDDGRVYEGEWAEHKANGKGKITMSDGSWQEGTFKDGKLLDGVFDWGLRSGVVINGMWFNDLPKKNQTNKNHQSSPTDKERKFTITYKVKLKEAKTETVVKGSVLGTIFGHDKMRFAEKKTNDKGEKIERTIIVKYSGTSIPNGTAKSFVENEDKDVRSGKAGTSTIEIVSVKEI